MDSLTAFQVKRYKDKICTRIERLNDRLFRLRGKRHMLNRSIQACKEMSDARLIFGIRDETTREIMRTKRLIAERNSQLQ